MIDLKKYTETQEYSDFFGDSENEKTINIDKLCSDLMHSIDLQDELPELPELQEPKCTIYIPSKGRPNEQKTYLHCIENNLSVKVVVEPQDYDLYKENIPAEHLIQMPKNDQGIRYVRTFIKNYSTELNEEYHWQMDDDMQYFFFRIDNKNKRVPLRKAVQVLENITELFNNVAISGMCNVAFAFAKKHTVQVNRLAHGVVLVNNSVQQHWREGTVEDWDYTLCVLEQGYCTLGFNHVTFQTATSGSTQGGNAMTDWESKEERRIFYENFCDLWPGYFQVSKIKNDKNSQGYSLKTKTRFLKKYKQKLKLKDII